MIRGLSVTHWLTLPNALTTTRYDLLCTIGSCYLSQHHTPYGTFPYRTQHPQAREKATWTAHFQLTLHYRSSLNNTKPDTLLCHYTSKPNSVNSDNILTSSCSGLPVTAVSMKCPVSLCKKETNKWLNTVFQCTKRFADQHKGNQSINLGIRSGCPHKNVLNHTYAAT